MAVIAVNEPPGELMYMMISRSGSVDSSESSCAMMSFETVSSIGMPRKMMRSWKSLAYGFIATSPREVRSMTFGRKYRLVTVDMVTPSAPGARTLRNLDGSGDDLVDEAV